MTSTAIDQLLRVGRRKGQQGHGTRPLDRGRELPLVAGAVAGDPAGDDLPAFGEEVAEPAGVLVIDQHRLVGAEAADLPPAHSPATEGAPLSLPSPLATLLHHLRHLLAEILSVGPLGLPVFALESPDRTRRRRWSVLGLPARHQPEHGIGELQVTFDLGERLRRRAVLEEQVEGAVLLGNDVGEIADPPLLNLADRAALLLDELANPRR